MKKIKGMLYLILVAFLVVNVSACRDIMKSEKPVKKMCSDSEKAEYYIDYDRYQNAKMYNYSVDITTPNVIEKTSELRKRLSQVKGGETESFSSSATNSNIRMYFPYHEADMIDKVLSNESDITSFNKSHSNIGNNYIEYAERYYSYKILTDNFDTVEKMIDEQSCNQLKTSNIRRMLEDNLRSYQSSMDSYKKQMNKIYLQIYIRQK